jgi:hypothetical protein
MKRQNECVHFLTASTGMAMGSSTKAKWMQCEVDLVADARAVVHVTVATEVTAVQTTPNPATARREPAAMAVPAEEVAEAVLTSCNTTRTVMVK